MDIWTLQIHAWKSQIKAWEEEHEKQDVLNSPPTVSLSVPTVMDVAGFKKLLEDMDRHTNLDIGTARALLEKYKGTMNPTNVGQLRKYIDETYDVPGTDGYDSSLDERDDSQENALFHRKLDHLSVDRGWESMNQQEVKRDLMQIRSQFSEKEISYALRYIENNWEDDLLAPALSVVGGF